jgi:hypothetical protein
LQEQTQINQIKLHEPLSSMQLFSSMRRERHPVPSSMARRRAARALVSGEREGIHILCQLLVAPFFDIQIGKCA